MRFEGRQLEVIVRLIMEYFSEQDIRELLRFKVDLSYEDYKMKNKRETVFHIIEVADKEGWLQKLISEVVKMRSNVQPLVDGLRDLLPSPVSSGGPYKVCVFGTGNVFINRDRLRRHVQQLAEGSERVLIIDGDEKSGRSYSAIYIRHVVSAHYEWQLAHVCLVRDFTGDVEPADLAKRIIKEARTGLSEAPTPQAEPSKEISELVSWTIGQLIGLGRSVFVIVDSFSKKQLSGPAKDFVTGLAHKIGLGSSPVRIILVGFKSLPPVSDVALTDITSPRLDKLEVMSFFGELQRQNQIATIGEEAMKELIRSIFDRCGSEQPELHLLSLAVRDVTDMLRTMHRGPEQRAS